MTITDTDTMALAVAALRTDGGTQSRQGINEETVAEYTRALHEGDQFPPVQVVYDGEHYWLTDGFHRLAAHRHAGQAYISVLVVPGTLQDAQWASYAANRTNALQRSNADKQRAVQGALKHPHGSGRSDGELARHVGVDRQTVTNWRKKLEATGEIRHSETRTGADGRTYRTGGMAVNGTRCDEPPPDKNAFENAMRGAPLGVPDDTERDLAAGDNDEQPAEEIAALPAVSASATPPSPPPAPARQQLPPRLELSSAPTAASEPPDEAQQVMRLRILQRAAELAAAELAVVPPYHIRAELVEEQARQLVQHTAVTMAAAMLSLSAILSEEGDPDV